MRNFNTTRDNKPFDLMTRSIVWAKATAFAGYNPGQFRLDACGAIVSFAHYGDTGSIYGWEIDHITPVSKGGSDDISNLQPLQWQNNRAKSDGPLACVVR